MNNSNYQNGLIYKICCNDLSITDVYVGSTTDLAKREANHLSCCNNPRSKKYNYTLYEFIRANGGIDNWKVILVKYFPCNAKIELEKEERLVLEELKATLNIRRPAKTKEEYKQDALMYYKNNCTILKEYQKEYYDNHREKSKEYYLKNKDKYKAYNAERIIAGKVQNIRITCECGLDYLKSCKTNHCKSKRHIELLKNKKIEIIENVETV